MFDTTTLLTFTAAAFALIVIPGPAVLYIVAQSIDQGRLAGIVSVLGIGLGALFHVSAAALGLSALLVSSALAFNVVKYLGAAYLIYLGVRKLLEKVETQQIIIPQQQKLSKVFRQGVIVNVLNPKTALFFFAFLPQFVNPAQGSPTLQIFVLGMIFVVVAIISDSGYALLAGTLGGWLKQSRSFLNIQRYASGSVYILLGLATAFSGSGRK